MASIIKFGYPYFMNNLLAILKAAKTYNISSLSQLECFLTVAAQQGMTVEEITGKAPTDSEYRIFLNQARKLMAYGYRGTDGLSLIMWQDSSKISALTLTRKGSALLKKIQKYNLN